MATTDRGVDFVTDRRRRGRHRRRAADLHRLRLPAVPARLRAGLPRLRRARACTNGVVFIGAGKLGLPDNAVVAFALGCDMVNVGPGGDAGDRLHPGAEVPHRHLPDRRRHPEPVARPRPRPDAEVGPGGELHQDPAPRPAEGRRGLRRRAPRADHHGRRRDPDRPDGVRPAAEVYGYHPAGACPRPPTGRRSPR